MLLQALLSALPASTISVGASGPCSTGQLAVIAILPRGRQSWWKVILIRPSVRVIGDTVRGVYGCWRWFMAIQMASRGPIRERVRGARIVESSGCPYFGVLSLLGMQWGHPLGSVGGGLALIRRRIWLRRPI